MNKPALCCAIEVFLENEEGRWFGLSGKVTPRAAAAMKKKRIAILKAIADRKDTSVKRGSLVRIRKHGPIFLLPFDNSYLPPSIDGIRLVRPFQDSMVAACMGKRAGDKVPVMTLFEGEVTLTITSVC